MKKTAIFGLCLFATLANNAVAGQTAVKGVGCMGPHPGAPDHWSEACNGQAACDAAMAAHNQLWHAGASAPTTPYVPPRTPAGKVVGAAAAGSLLGGLGGSLFTSTAGNNQAVNGAMAAGGGLTAIAAIGNAARLPLVGGAIVSAAAGAAGAYGVAKYNEEQGTLSADKTPMVVGVTAAATAVSFVIAKVAGGSKPQWAPRFLGPKARLDFPVSVRFASVRLVW